MAVACVTAARINAPARRCRAVVTHASTRSSSSKKPQKVPQVRSCTTLQQLRQLYSKHGKQLSPSLLASLFSHAARLASKQGSANTEREQVQKMLYEAHLRLVAELCTLQTGQLVNLVMAMAALRYTPQAAFLQAIVRQLMMAKRLTTLDCKACARLLNSLSQLKYYDATVYDAWLDHALAAVANLDMQDCVWLLQACANSSHYHSAAFQALAERSASLLAGTRIQSVDSQTIGNSMADTVSERGSDPSFDHDAQVILEPVASKIGLNELEVQGDTIPETTSGSAVLTWPMLVALLHACSTLGLQHNKLRAAVIEVLSSSLGIDVVTAAQHTTAANLDTKLISNATHTALLQSTNSINTSATSTGSLHNDGTSHDMPLITSQGLDISNASQAEHSTPSVKLTPTLLPIQGKCSLTNRVLLVWALAMLQWDGLAASSAASPGALGHVAAKALHQDQACDIQSGLPPGLQDQQVVSGAGHTTPQTMQGHIVDMQVFKMLVGSCMQLLMQQDAEAAGRYSLSYSQFLRALLMHAANVGMPAKMDAVRLLMQTYYPCANGSFESNARNRTTNADALQNEIASTDTVLMPVTNAQPVTLLPADNTVHSADVAIQKSCSNPTATTGMDFNVCDELLERCVAHHNTTVKVDPSGVQYLIQQLLMTICDSAMLEHVVADSLFCVDVLCHYNGKLVAVEVDGPSHFFSNAVNVPLGSTRARNRLLASLGMHVVVVPQHEFAELEGAEDRIKYLKNKLNGCWAS